MHDAIFFRLKQGFAMVFRSVTDYNTRPLPASDQLTPRPLLFLVLLFRVMNILCMTSFSLC